MEGREADTPLTAADDAIVRRALFWLVVFPFTLPMWFSLKRRRPELAESIRWAAWFNAGQSVLVVVVLALAWWAFSVLPGMVQHLVGTYMAR